MAVTKPEDTRMQRARLKSETDSAQQARVGELSMISAKETADDAQGVWDGQNGELIESGMAPEQENFLRRQAQIVEDPDEIISDEDAHPNPTNLNVRSDGIGPLGVPIDLSPLSDDVEEAMPAPTPRATMVVESAHRQERKVVIRVNADLEPTIGQGPNARWNFLKGKRYRVPEHVANHLHEKGYVSSWG